MRRSSEKGIALVLVISSLALLSLLMVEFTFRSQMNVQISGNFKNAAKAAALARSGIYFGILELKVYDEIRELPLLKQIPGFREEMLDMIWQFGFVYPPVASKKATFGTQKAVNELIKSSDIDGRIQVTVTDESAKINLNHLGNPEFREGIVQQIEFIFEQIKTGDEAVASDYRDLRIIDLLYNVADWIDADNIRVAGGDERTYYDRLPTPYRPKDALLDTLSELSLIEGFDDDRLFDLLLPYVTVYPTGGINVNTADKTMLLAISPELTDEDAERIMEHRKTNRFPDVKAFEAFCRETLLKTANFNRDPKVPLATRSHIFSLVSTAEVKGTRQIIRAVVDLSKRLPDGTPQILYWNLN